MEVESQADQKASSGLKLFIIEILVIAIVVIGILAALNYFHVLSLGIFSLPNSKATITPSQSISTPTSNLSSSASVELPIPPNNPHVRSTGILYSLIGTVQSVKSQNGTNILTFSDKSSQLPEISLLGNVKIQRVIINSGKTSLAPANLSDLSPKTSITLSAVFDITTKKWSGYDITIFSSAPTKNNTIIR